MKMAPVNYGIKLNFPPERRTADVNILDNKVGTRGLQRLRPPPSPPPLTRRYSQSEAGTDEGKRQPFGSTSVEKKQMRCSDHRVDLFRRAHLAPSPRPPPLQAGP